MDELLKSLRNTISERMASPLIGSFVISWCLFNYKFLIILFSDNSVTNTINLIDLLAFPGKWSVLIFGILLPLLSALAYIFLYPLPARYIYGYVLKQQKKNKGVLHEIEENELLDVAQSRQIREFARKVERESQQRIDALNSEITDLRAALENRRNLPNDAPVVHSKSTRIAQEVPLTEMQNSILDMVSGAPAGTGKSLSDFLNSFNVDERNNVANAIDDLLVKDYLDMYAGHIGGPHYSLTKKGREYFRNNLLHDVRYTNVIKG